MLNWKKRAIALRMELLDTKEELRRVKQALKDSEEKRGVLETRLTEQSRGCTPEDVLETLRGKMKEVLLRMDVSRGDAGLLTELVDAYCKLDACGRLADMGDTLRSAIGEMTAGCKIPDGIPLFDGMLSGAGAAVRRPDGRDCAAGAGK